MTDSQKLDLLLAKMGHMEGDISELKTDVSQLKTDVSQLKTDVSQLKTDVSQLKTDVTQLKTDVSQLKTSVSQLTIRVDNLTERVTTLELHMENVTDKNIQIVAEGHLDLIRHLHEAEKISNNQEMFQVRLTFLEGEVNKMKSKLELT